MLFIRLLLLNARYSRSSEGCWNTEYKNVVETDCSYNNVDALADPPTVQMCCKWHAVAELRAFAPPIAGLARELYV